MRGWAHSSFGRKIEKAVHMREKGLRIAIVAEPYWIGQLRQSSLAVDGGHPLATTGRTGVIGQVLSQE